MKNRFDLIIFDWDGTLVDSIDWIVQCLQNAARQCECEIPESAAIKNIIGLSIERAMDELFPEVSENRQEQLMAVYSQQFLSKQISRNDLFSGVYDMLMKLKQQGILLAVATGKKKLGLENALQGTGLAGFFDATRSADQTASKPNPLMIDQIVEEVKVNKKRTLMVGDSVHDLQMAINARVEAVAVSCGAHSERALKQYKPVSCLQHTRELLAVNL